MGHVLLLGAGFSRNWGGWVASEAFEYLLGSPHLDGSLRLLLWKHRNNGGFERTLADLQGAFAQQNNATTEQPIRKFEKAVAAMFDDMDEAFGLMNDFDFKNPSSDRQVGTFLRRFDAIFTLNQDLLMERKYLNDDVAGKSAGKWDGWQIPGTREGSDVTDYYGNAKPPTRSPADAADFTVDARKQPYFKLHGSSNWVDGADRRLLIMGGNKVASISGHSLLSWYHQKFADYLSEPDTKLMVIGYGFGDEHINQALYKAAEAASFKMFVIDSLGVDAINSNRDATIGSGSNISMNTLSPQLIGASRRPLRDIFGADRVEHSKVMRFF